MRKNPPGKPGTLLLIGGAEDKLEQKYILRTLLDYIGGRHARLTILPSGSELHETGTDYQQIFNDFGVRWVQVVPLFKRSEAESAQVARELEGSDGIFLTGGDQSKIVNVLRHTAAFKAIVKAYENGAVIAGTSAGAAALSDPMIAGGSRGSLPRQGLARISPGLGLTRYLLIDQHFHQRERLGRLVAAAISFPHMLGVGIDEDTAAIVTPDDRLEVIGRGTVTIVDGCQVDVLNRGILLDGSPIAFSELVLHTLVHGNRFDLLKRAVMAREKEDEGLRESSL